MEDVIGIATSQKKKGWHEDLFQDNETLLLFFVIFVVMFCGGCLKGITQETLLLFFLLLALIFNGCTIC